LMEHRGVVHLVDRSVGVGIAVDEAVRALQVAPIGDIHQGRWKLTGPKVRGIGREGGLQTVYGHVLRSVGLADATKAD
ncbi:MAG: hypothetical protein QGG10_08335, partial [Arenicellales bacterium]|nr:hypothetical protein [Arenicellales bacterium]